MYVDPFWFGFFFGFVANIVLFITLCYMAGRRKK